MKKASSIFLLSLAFLTGCQEQNVVHFWDRNSIDYSDVQAAEDQFARFAELAVAASPDDALTSMDVLFDKLKEDPVAYYLYSDWIDAAFYNLLSPCRNAAIYSKAVERIVKDGILSESDYAPYIQKRDWIQYNQPGREATVPGLSLKGQRTMVLVLDQSCPSCKEALKVLTPSLGTRKIAVCCTYGPLPEEEGWEIIAPENAQSVFDPHLTPVYFVVDADGTVETGYTIAL